MTERRNSRDFRNLTTSQAEEDSYDYVKYRVDCKFTSLTGSVAHLVKGALGGGILGGHVAYMKAGALVAVGLNIACGIYMTYCLYLLVQSAQILYRRTRIPVMSYADVGEASFKMHHHKIVNTLSRPFRFTIDTLICIDLFGSCACYQIIIAKQIKQLVENTHATQFEGSYPGYPGLRVYLAVMIPLVILICLIRHLKYLAPFSLAANVVIFFCIALAVYYAFYLNPDFDGMVMSTSAYGAFALIGMTVFSMSCAGIVIAVENNMREPHKFPLALAIGMFLIICCTVSVSFFGYAAFLEDCDSPITINFPMSIWPKLLKAAIAVMVYVTHALNFWVPFNLCFYYLKKRHPREKVVFWELVYRAIIVTIIGLVAIAFPDINAIMGFIGTFCLSNMAFIWPNVINLMVVWERPGLGYMNWRLWRSLTLILFGLVIFVCGTMVTATEMVLVFINLNVKIEP